MAGEGHAWLRGGGGMHDRGMHGGGHVCMAEEIVTASDGTHPTGMHSCWMGLRLQFEKINNQVKFSTRITYNFTSITYVI